MTQSIITAKTAIELVLARKIKTTKLALLDTRFKKTTFVGACAFMAVGILGGAAAHLWKNPYLILGALCAVGLSMILAAMYQFAGFWSDFSEIKNAERTVGNQLIDEFNSDMDLIGNLATSFQPHHLEYAKECFSTMASQLRSRVALLVGALDKVGLVPLTITAYFSWMKAKKVGLEFGGIEWLVVAFGVLYLFAIRAASLAQWMDRIVLIYKQALSVQAATKQS